MLWLNRNKRHIQFVCKDDFVYKDSAISEPSHRLGKKFPSTPVIKKFFGSTRGLGTALLNQDQGEKIKADVPLELLVVIGSLRDEINKIANQLGL